MWFFYQRWSVRSTRSIVKRVDILAVCTYTICDALPCQLSMSFDHGCSKCRNKPTLLCEKRIAKTQELWMNKCCHIALCHAFLMKHGIIKLYITCISLDI